MPAPASKPLDAYKRDAARLFRAMRSADELMHAAAMQRVSRLVSLLTPGQMQLKHALAVIAMEAGYPSWTTLKQAREGLDFSEFFATPGLKDSLNHWFTTYEDAKAHQAQNGGVVLPYRHHVFVTSLEILPRLGCDRDDPDWRDIGLDFVKPASDRALQAVKAKLQRRFGHP